MTAMSEERKAGERLLFRCGAILLGGWLAYILIPWLWDKLSPFVLAIPLAAMLQPLIRFLEKKLKIKRPLASVVLVLLTVVLGVGILVYFLTFAIGQTTELVNNSGEIIKGMVAGIKGLTDSILESAVNVSPESERWVREAINGVVKEITDYGPVLAQSILAWLLNLATGAPYMVIYISFLAMALYFISKDYGAIRAYLPGGARHRQDSASAQLTNKAVRSLIGYLRVQGIFAAMVLVVSWIYLSCFGHPYPAVLSIAAAIMEMIPMVGSGLLYIVLGILHFIGGNPAQGWQVLALTLGLQLLRRLLEPKLMSDSMSITPLQSLIGMFVGLRAGGILGLIGGPVAMAVLVGAIRGRIFESIRKDLHTVIAYFRRRWAPAPEPPAERHPNCQPDGKADEN